MIRQEKAELQHEKEIAHFQWDIKSFDETGALLKQQFENFEFDRCSQQEIQSQWLINRFATKIKKCVDDKFTECMFLSENEKQAIN